jgi:GNAT superfamily N-acetyltransferase
MKTRQAEPGDAGRLVELFQQLGYANKGAAMHERLLGQAAQLDDRIIVAENAAQIVGVIVVNIIQPIHSAEPWAMVSALVVDENTRSAGVGAALLEQAQRHAGAMGCSQIELSSNVARTRAHAFYLRHGFVEVRMRFVKKLPPI